MGTPWGWGRGKAPRRCPSRAACTGTVAVGTEAKPLLSGRVPFPPPYWGQASGLPAGDSAAHLGTRSRTALGPAPASPQTWLTASNHMPRGERSQRPRPLLMGHSVGSGQAKTPADEADPSTLGHTLYPQAHGVRAAGDTHPSREPGEPPHKCILQSPPGTPRKQVSSPVLWLP